MPETMVSGMRIDFHAHTNRSIDAVPGPRELVRAAKKTGLDGIAITDHNRFFPEREARSLSQEFGILVIPGIEGGQIAVQRHWIALGSGCDPGRIRIDQILASVRENGGVSIAPHPHTRLGYADYGSLGFDAVESLNGSEPAASRRVTNPAHIPEVGGSDAHALPMLGYTWTEVDADGTVESVLEAVRKGRCRAAGSAIPCRDLIGFYPQFVMHRILREPRTAFSHACRIIREVREIRSYESCHSPAEVIHPRGDRIS
jgi:predicted metal-dependent phosphoesterase TrpH